MQKSKNMVPVVGVEPTRSCPPAYLFLLGWLELGEIGKNLLQTITKSLQFS
jgi:hypothetical protein